MRTFIPKSIERPSFDPMLKKTHSMRLTCRVLLPLLLLPALLLTASRLPFPGESGDLVLVKTLYGDIRPKSVVHSGQGLFFAQNMMYRHSITVYDRDFRLLKTISDEVNLHALGVEAYPGDHRGAPVEAAFSHSGRYAWVSQYHMEGPGFENPGTDNCQTSTHYDKGFVYKIDTQSLEIVAAVEVGCVPKFLATSPDDRYLLVSNWCSGDLSVVDIDMGREISRIPLGRYPRGIAIDSRSRRAYVAVMGADRITEIDLSTLSITQEYNVGRRPRHLCLGPFDRFLYMSLNNDGAVAKLDLANGSVTRSASTGSLPRSMILSPMGGYLYVVNYGENTLSKLRTADMREVERVDTQPKPIGLTLDPLTRRLWVACYSGSIMVFEDAALNEKPLPDFTWTDPLPQPPQAEAPLLPVLSFLSSAARTPVIAALPQQTATDEFKPLSAKSLASAENTSKPVTAPVIKPADRPAAGAEATAPVAAKKRYTLVLGSFSTPENAEKLIARLADQGLEASLLPADDKYRVSHGDYENIEAAKSAMQALKDDSGVDAWVLKR